MTASPHIPGPDLAATTGRPRALYQRLCGRCWELGLPLWHCDAAGAIVEEPDQPEMLRPWLHSAELRSILASAAGALIAEPHPQPREIAPGHWVLPVTEPPGHRRTAIFLALALTDRATSAPANAQRRDHREIPRLWRILGWCYEELVRGERDGRALEQFAERLTQAYEEVQLLYRIANLLTSHSDPAASVTGIARQLQQILPFGWLAIRFNERRSIVKALTEKTLVAGEPPCGLKTMERLAEPLIQASGLNHQQLLSPQEHPLAAAASAEVLATPIVQDGCSIGLLLAGNKSGPDPCLSSFETQFVQGAASLLAAFHENLARLVEQQDLFLGTLRALTAAIDAKDRYTRGHSERVAMLAAKLSEAMGLDKATVEQFRIAGLVHDIGKIGVPEAVLCKNGRLSDEESALVKLHPGIGYDILKGVGALAAVLPAVLFHHERWDGRGYPQGLAGEQIPLIARVVALADIFDAMSSSRSYRKAIPRPGVLEEIARCSGTQLDPELAALFARLDFRDFDQALAAFQDGTTAPLAA